MTVKSEAREAARAVEANPIARVSARGGYAANGVMHVLIGVIVLTVAFGGDAETDQAGAFKAIAAAPWGFAGLWMLAIALAALGLWHAVEGFLVGVAQDDITRRASAWGRRVSEWGQALVFLALGVVAASVALGAEPDAEESAEGASRGVLALPAGPWMLGLVAAGIAAGGVAFVWMGVRRSFEKKVDLPAGGLGAVVRGLGVAGFVAKGVALLIVGALLMVAALTVDPATAGGLDGAIAALIALPYGPWLAGAVGIGLIAYGVFCLFRARFARL